MGGKWIWHKADKYYKILRYLPCTLREYHCHFWKVPLCHLPMWTKKSFLYLRGNANSEFYSSFSCFPLRLIILYIHWNLQKTYCLVLQLLDVYINEIVKLYMFSSVTWFLAYPFCSWDSNRYNPFIYKVTQIPLKDRWTQANASAAVNTLVRVSRPCEFSAESEVNSTLIRKTSWLSHGGGATVSTSSAHLIPFTS